MSEETASKIDAVVRDFVESAHQRAKDILTENIDDLHAIANALLEYETLSGDEIKAVMRGEGVSRPDPNEPTNKPGGTVSAVPKAGKRRSSGGSAPPFGPEPQPEG